MWALSVRGHRAEPISSPVDRVQDVIAGSPQDQVATPAAAQFVAPTVADEHVVAGTAVDSFDVACDQVAFSAGAVVAAAVEVGANGLSVTAVVGDVLARTAVEEVSTRTAGDDVPSRAAEELVVAASPEQTVEADASAKDIVAGTAVEPGRTFGRDGGGEEDIVPAAAANVSRAGERKTAVVCIDTIGTVSDRDEEVEEVWFPRLDSWNGTNHAVGVERGATMPGSDLGARIDDRPPEPSFVRDRHVVSLARRSPIAKSGRLELLGGSHDFGGRRLRRLAATKKCRDYDGGHQSQASSVDAKSGPRLELAVPLADALHRGEP